MSAVDAAARGVCELALPPVEAQLARLIQDHGGRLDRMDFLKRAQGAGIKTNTALTYLKSSILLRPRQGPSDQWVELLVISGSTSQNSQTNQS